MSMQERCRRALGRWQRHRRQCHSALGVLVLRSVGTSSAEKQSHRPLPSLSQVTCHFGLSYLPILKSHHKVLAIPGERQTLFPKHFLAPGTATGASV